MNQTSLPAPLLDLAEPGTFTFGVLDAVRGARLNVFGQALRDPLTRSTFNVDDVDAFAHSGLNGDEVALVQARDWTGLIRAGGHLQLVLVIAAAVGNSLWDIGAHNANCAPELLVASCPRRVVGLPSKMREL